MVVFKTNLWTICHAYSFMWKKNQWATWRFASSLCSSRFQLDTSFKLLKTLFWRDNRWQKEQNDTFSYQPASLLCQCLPVLLPLPCFSKVQMFLLKFTSMSSQPQMKSSYFPSHKSTTITKKNLRSLVKFPRRLCLGSLRAHAPVRHLAKYSISDPS